MTPTQIANAANKRLLNINDANIAVMDALFLLSALARRVAKLEEWSAPSPPPPARKFEYYTQGREVYLGVEGDPNSALICVVSPERFEGSAKMIADVLNDAISKREERNP